MRYGIHKFIYCVIVWPREKRSSEKKEKGSLQMSETEHKKIIPRYPIQIVSIWINYLFIFSILFFFRRITWSNISRFIHCKDPLNPDHSIDPLRIFPQLSPKMTNKMRERRNHIRINWIVMKNGDERKKRSSFRETGPLYLVIVLSDPSYPSTGSLALSRIGNDMACSGTTKIILVWFIS